VWAVHDWDSLAWQPEAAVAGAASGSFASAGPPMLAPVESSEAFLVAYQDIRGRLFTAVELQVAWAASLWMAAYNACHRDKNDLQARPMFRFLPGVPHTCHTRCQPAVNHGH